MGETHGPFSLLLLSAQVYVELAERDKWQDLTIGLISSQP
jgi:hypothetical protein